MIDKVQKILSEIATRKLCTMDEHMAFYNDTAKEDYRFLSDIEELIKALQEEPASKDKFTFTSLPRLLDRIKPTDRAKWYSSRLADALEKEGYITDAKIVRESIKLMNGEKVPMATMDEEPVSEDLQEACDSYYDETWDEHGGRAMVVDGCHDIWFPSHATDDFFKAGAKWQKEQMMNGAVLCGVDGWFINNKRNCRKNGRFHKYYESTITHDKKLPMENGKDYRLIVIKED